MEAISAVTKKSDALTRSAVWGALWQLVGAGWQTAIQLGASMVLARILCPADFGIMGMAIIVQGIVKQSGDLSVATGVIAKGDVTQEDLSTAFWTSLAIRTLLFFITFAIAHHAAIFYESPEVKWVLRTISFTFFFSAFSVIPAALLKKNLRFGLSKMIEGSGFLLQSLLAILFAVVFDMHYWALVISLLIANFTQTCIICFCARWLPSFVFSRSSFRYMFRYGINGMGSSLMGYFSQNLDYLIVGKLLGASSLGIYEFAYRIPYIAFNRVATPISTVLFPILSQVQNDNERLGRGYIKVAKFIAIILFPVLGGLAAVANQAVAVLWGDQWLAAIIPLQILCMRCAIQSVTKPISVIFLCKNRPDLPLKISFFSFIFTFAAVGGLGFVYGLVGVAAGMLVATIPNVVPIWIAFRIINIPLSSLFAALMPPTICAATSTFLTLVTVHLLILKGNSDYIILAISILVGVITYATTMWFFFRETRLEVFKACSTVISRKSS